MKGEQRHFCRMFSALTFLPDTDSILAEKKQTLS